MSNIQRCLRDSRAALRALDEERSAGTLSETDYVSRRAALGERLLSALGAEPTPLPTALYVGLAGAVLLSMASLGLYRWLSPSQPLVTPAASEPAAMPEHGTDMQAAIAKLAAELREHPDDAEGWALLGRTYEATERYAEAREAFRRALEAAPGDADLEREYTAAETPEDPESALVDAVANGSSGAAWLSPSAPAALSGTADSAHIVVNVRLDPKLKANVAPTDTLFVFAKAAHGPPMPLAIARLTAAQLPASVTLTDEMSMVPGLTLSQFPQIVVGARISKSGNAVAQRGDLQTPSVTATTAQAASVALVIAERVD
jgi:cytochrome c-type biogenesis protein CcmH